MVYSGPISEVGASAVVFLGAAIVNDKFNYHVTGGNGKPAVILRHSAIMSRKFAETTAITTLRGNGLSANPCLTALNPEWDYRPSSWR